MSWTNTVIGNNWYDFDATIGGAFDVTTNTGNYLTVTSPDPLIDWLPYKWKKYIPTWHLVRSYKS